MQLLAAHHSVAKLDMLPFSITPANGPQNNKNSLLCFKLFQTDCIQNGYI